MEQPGGTAARTTGPQASTRRTTPQPGIVHSSSLCCELSQCTISIMLMPLLLLSLPSFQVHLLDPERAGQPQRLQTEGINFPGLWEQQQLLDVNL